MTSWIDYFYVSVSGAALLLSAMGLWFTAVIPGTDRWSRRFFLWYFLIFLLCGLTSAAEMILASFPGTVTALKYVLFLESILLSLPMPMLTVYLVYCSGENLHTSRLLRSATVLWIVFQIVNVLTLFVDGFSDLTQGYPYGRGPLYPLLLSPVVVIMLLNLAATIRRRKKLSRKLYLSFLIVTMPMTAALIVQLFIDVFPLIDISLILTALTMYGLVLSDQIEQDRRNRQEIIRQQQEILRERASVMVLRMRPHFIYNTLMCIYSLCNQDPKEARQVTLDFTNYLRKNFSAVSSDSTIPFTAELEHTRAYLAVEQAQHKHMLSMEYETPFTRFRLPPLTLQPLVENAVKHGMNPGRGPLHIAVRTCCTDSGIRITVEDDGAGFDPSSEEGGPHPTLNNIRQRLELMCGGSMDIRPRDGGGMTVTISLPAAQLIPE